MSQVVSVVYNGKRLEGIAEKIGDTIWFHLDGEVLTWRERSQVYEGGVQNLGGGSLTAPMPGKVIKVLKDVGQEVDAGEVVIVMEAMKMEYSVTSNGSGKILKIGCAPGDQVEMGRLLAEVEEA